MLFPSMSIDNDVTLGVIAIFDIAGVSVNP
jgi:hypothetical protein